MRTDLMTLFSTSRNKLRRYGMCTYW